MKIPKAIKMLRKASRDIGIENGLKKQASGPHKTTKKDQNSKKKNTINPHQINDEGFNYMLYLQSK